MKQPMMPKPRNIYPTWPGAILVIGSAAATMIVAACAPLAPGADPIVVRTEQSQAVAQPTFDLVLNVDNADRGFWRTNAPAFHTFCEWLRTPTQYSGSLSNVPRCVAIQFNLDDLKTAYKGARTVGNSNALYEALITLEKATTQAGSWSAIVTNSVHP